MAQASSVAEAAIGEANKAAVDLAQNTQKLKEAQTKLEKTLLAVVSAKQKLTGLAANTPQAAQAKLKAAEEALTVIQEKVASLASIKEELPAKIERAQAHLQYLKLRFQLASSTTPTPAPAPSAPQDEENGKNFPKAPEGNTKKSERPRHSAGYKAGTNPGKTGGNIVTTPSKSKAIDKSGKRATVKATAKTKAVSSASATPARHALVSQPGVLARTGVAPAALVTGALVSIGAGFALRRRKDS